MKIGVLAVQGAFIEHRKMLESLGAECVGDSTESQGEGIQGIVLPGGETTVQGKLLHKLNMFGEIRTCIREGLPVLATCAGMILLAQIPLQRSGNPSGHPSRYGSAKRIRKTAGQLHHGSAGQGHRQISDGIHSSAVHRIRGRFRCRSSGHRDSHIVAVRYGNQLGLSFHPEMTEDTRIHEYFLKMIQ